MKSVQQQCAYLHTIQSDIKRLLASTYNGAVSLSEHPEYEGRLRSFLATYETSLIKCYGDLAAIANRLIDVWSSEALRSAPNLEPVSLALDGVNTIWPLTDSDNGHGSHKPTSDLPAPLE